MLGFGGWEAGFSPIHVIPQFFLKLGNGMVLVNFEICFRLCFRGQSSFLL